MLRIFVKRRSVGIIKYLLDENLKSVQGTKIISRYLHCIRKVQSFVRDFLTCRATKLFILQNIWNQEALLFESEITKKLQKNKNMDTMMCRGKSIVQTKFSKSSKMALKKINANISAWKETDKSMDALLRVNTKVKRPQNPKVEYSPKVKNVPSRTRDSVLAILIQQTLRKNTRVKRRSVISKHARIKTIFHAKDMGNLYNLSDANAGVKRGINPNIAVMNQKLQSISVFWKLVGEREDCVHETIKKLYSETYQRVYGDPLATNNTTRRVRSHRLTKRVSRT